MKARKKKSTKEGPSPSEPCFANVRDGLQSEDSSAQNYVRYIIKRIQEAPTEPVRLDIDPDDEAVMRLVWDMLNIQLEERRLRESIHDYAELVDKKDPKAFKKMIACAVSGPQKARWRVEVCDIDGREKLRAVFYGPEFQRPQPIRFIPLQSPKLAEVQIPYEKQRAKLHEQHEKARTKWDRKKLVKDLLQLKKDQIASVCAVSNAAKQHELNHNPELQVDYDLAVDFDHVTKVNCGDDVQYYSHDLDCTVELSGVVPDALAGTMCVGRVWKGEDWMRDQCAPLWPSEIPQLLGIRRRAIEIWKQRDEATKKAATTDKRRKLGKIHHRRKETWNDMNVDQLAEIYVAEQLARGHVSSCRGENAAKARAKEWGGTWKPSRIEKALAKAYKKLRKSN
jgi:hypothetical protein